MFPRLCCVGTAILLGCSGLLQDIYQQKRLLSILTFVPISETEGGKLVIDPRHDVEPLPHSITLTPGPYRNREIIGTYLLGFDIIRVEPKTRISFEVRDTVKSAVNRLIGLEIVEEDNSKIVLQCLLEPSSFPPEKILRRGYSIAAGMNRDVTNAFLDGDVQLARNVVV